MGVYIWNRLPSEYQEVEYIQSSGTQFIDTGYLITPTTEVSIDYQYINANNQDFAFGVGSDNNTSSGMTFCSYIGKTGGVTYFKAGLSDGTGSSTFTNNGPGVDTNRHKFVLNNGHFLTYNSSGTLQKDVTTSATFTRTATHSFGLFCWWRTDTSARDNKTSAKLYGCEVKDNGVLQRHFVPCYRKSDSVIGLYDLVNNQFYTNAGSGTFTKGNDVNNYYEKVMKNAYIGEYREEWKILTSTTLYYPFYEDNLDKTGKTTLSTSGTKSNIGYTFSNTSLTYGSGTDSTSTFCAYWLKPNSSISTGSYVNQIGNVCKGNMNYSINHNNSSYTNCVAFKGSNNTWYSSGSVGAVQGEWIFLAYGFNGTQGYVYVNGEKHIIATTSAATTAMNKNILRYQGGTMDVTISDFIIDTVDRENEIVEHYNQTKFLYS